MRYRPRQPTPEDLERLNRAIAFITAYDLGEETGDYNEFANLTNEALWDDPVEAVRASAQLSWMLLESIASAGISKEKILSWYGIKFMDRAESLKEQ